MYCSTISAMQEKTLLLRCTISHSQRRFSNVISSLQSLRYTAMISAVIPPINATKWRFAVTAALSKKKERHGCLPVDQSAVVVASVRSIDRLTLPWNDKVEKVKTKDRSFVSNASSNSYEQKAAFFLFGRAANRQLLFDEFRWCQRHKKHWSHPWQPRSAWQLCDNIKACSMSSFKGKKNKGKASELNLQKSTADMLMRKRWRRALLDRVRYASLSHRQAWLLEMSVDKCCKARLYRSRKQVQITERDNIVNWMFVNKSTCLNAVIWTTLMSWIHTRRHSSTVSYCMRAISIIRAMCDRLHCVTMFGRTAHARTNAAYTRISTEMTSIVHIGDTVKAYGPLNSYSTFNFESLLGTLELCDPRTAVNPRPLVSAQ